MRTGRHHPIDPANDGQDIAKTVLDHALGQGFGKKAVDALDRYRYPIALIQKGQLSKLVDAAEHQAAQNVELQHIIHSLRLELEDAQGGNLAERVLEFCQQSHSAGVSALETSLEIGSNFPDVMAPIDSGGSFQILMARDSYIVFDATDEKWSIRWTPLF